MNEGHDAPTSTICIVPSLTIMCTKTLPYLKFHETSFNFSRFRKRVNDQKEREPQSTTNAPLVGNERALVFQRAAVLLYSQ